MGWTRTEVVANIGPVRLREQIGRPPGGRSPRTPGRRRCRRTPPASTPARPAACSKASRRPRQLRRGRCPGAASTMRTSSARFCRRDPSNADCRAWWALRRDGFATLGLEVRAVVEERVVPCPGVVLGARVPPRAGPAPGRLTPSRPGEQLVQEHRAHVRLQVERRGGRSANATTPAAVAGPMPGSSHQLLAPWRAAARPVSAAHEVGRRSSARGRGGCSRAPATGSSTSDVSAAASASIVGNSAMKRSQNALSTRATWVCCSMTSDTSTA